MAAQAAGQVQPPTQPNDEYLEEEALATPLEIDQAADPDLRSSDKASPVVFEPLYPVPIEPQQGLSLRLNPALVIRDGSLVQSAPTIPSSELTLKSLDVEYSKSLNNLELFVDFGLSDSLLNLVFVDYPIWGWKLRTGIAPTIEAGTETKYHKSTEVFPSVYLDRNSPFGGKSPLVEFRSGGGELGSVRVQMIQDVINRDPAQRGYYSLERSQPAFAFEWTANFGALSPLLQFGTYDQNHSNYKSFAIRYRFMNFQLLYDYLLDARFLFDHSDRSASIDKISRLRFEIFYRPLSSTEMRASFIDFGVIQGGIDVFGNPPIEDEPSYSDNYRGLGLSVAHEWSPGFKVYSAWQSQQARFLDSTTAELNDSDEYSLSKLEIGLSHTVHVTTR